MAQTKILLDSNSYFRLAQNIHPLLFETFGGNDYTLYVHSDLMTEFKRSSRLQNKFHWVDEPEYIENRKRPLRLGAKTKKAINNTFEYMWEHVKDDGLGPSKVDIKILATAAELEVQVVTDDGDMIEFAEMYAIPHMRTIELMKLMLDEGHIDMALIRRIVAQWIYDNDTPFKGFEGGYSELFNETAPTEDS